MKWKIINPETEDEGDKCDWESPVDARKAGAKFNLKDGLVF